MAGLGFASGALWGIGLVTLAGPAQAFAVVAPTLSYGGKSQFEWAKLFWVSVLAAPDAGNPQYSGSDGSSPNLINDLASPVFFLSGTNSGDSVTRHIRVQASKALFFPVFNAFAAEPQRLAFNGVDLCKQTEVFDPSSQTLFASVDGVPIASSGELTANFQQGCRSNSASPDVNLFKINQPGPQPSYFQNLVITSWLTPPSPYTLADGPEPWDTLTDGVWVMLEPLAPGKYTIRFGMTPAADAPFKVSQDNTWIVTSVEAPGPLPLFGAAAAYGWSRRYRRRLIAVQKSTS